MTTFFRITGSLNTPKCQFTHTNNLHRRQHWEERKEFYNNAKD